MFLQLKLILLKKRIIKPLFGIIFGIFFVSLIVNLGSWDSCNLKQYELIDAIKVYETSLDPELCESILFKIDEFNEQCDMDIKILDCG